MRKVNFDYGNTCPKIDSAIRDAKLEIERYINDILNDACPLLDEKTCQRLANDYAEEMYARLENAFEEVRTSNSDMREAADEQISELKDEIDSLEDRVKELELQNV